jgi:hypothetical protein
MKKIHLINGPVARVSAEDFARLSRFQWRAKRIKGRYVYVARSDPRNPRKPIYMHRQVLRARRGRQVDHVNGNGLDNTRRNLRLCNYCQNQYNRHSQKNNTSGFIGVNWNINKQAWEARIQAKGVRRFLGWFSSVVKAAGARDAAARKFHGPFAVQSL